MLLAHVVLIWVVRFLGILPKRRGIVHAMVLDFRIQESLSTHLHKPPSIDIIDLSLNKNHAFVHNIDGGVFNEKIQT